MAKWAVFDFDGTLLPGESFEKRFIEHLTRQRIIPFGNYLSYGLFALKGILRGRPVEGFKANKRYLKNLPEKEIRQEAEKFFRTEIQDRLSAAGRKRLEKLRKEGYRIMLLSGAPDILKAPLQSRFQPDFLLCARLQLRDGRITGELEGLHPYGKLKATLLNRLADSLDIDFRQSIVFANHHSDIAHMELFGTAVTVNPTRKLSGHARKRGWKIETWR